MLRNTLESNIHTPGPGKCHGYCSPSPVVPDASVAILPTCQGCVDAQVHMMSSSGRGR